MKKIIVILLLISATLYGDHHIPEFSFQADESLFIGTRSTIIYNLDDWDLLLNFQGKINLALRGNENLNLGFYYRFLKNLKAGLFYSLEIGARHDDDWINLNGEWLWVNSSTRAEHSLMADISPRFLLSFLPGRNWVINFKTRYFYNFYNNHQKIYLNPELSYFWLINRQPVLNTSLAYGLYFPLNFSEALIYKQGPYLNILYHLNDILKLEFQSDLSLTSWTSGVESAAQGEHYTVNEWQLIFRFGLVFLI